MYYDNEILIIEEQDSVSNLYKKFLANIYNKELDLKVLKSSEEVDEYIKNNVHEIVNNISLVLSEAELSGNEILSLLERIKSIQPKINIFIISNKVDISRLKKALKFGISDWIEKPVTPDEFHDLVYSSIFRGNAFDEKVRELYDKLGKTSKNDFFELNFIENSIKKLFYENPSRYETHDLLAKYYSKIEYTELSAKHEKASEALKG